VFKVHGIRPQLLGLVAAAVVPFLILIGIGLWNQSRAQQAQALQRAHAEARVIAARVDDHIDNLEHLMAGLAFAISTNPSDVEANDALLSRLRPDLPRYIATVLVVALDGENIGNASGRRYNVRDRDFFQRVLAGEQLVVGDPLSTDIGWVFPVARAVRNAAGELQAVLVVGTVIESVQEALRVDELPPRSVVRIVSEQRIGIARFPDVSGWVGGSHVASENVARHLRLGEGSEVIDWGDGATRITGYATAHLAPWMVAVGLPAEIDSATIAQRLEWSVLFSALAIAVGSLIAWMLSGRIIRPLRRLERDAAILAAGDLSHRTAIASPDEVRKLSDAFNQMASSLDRRQNEARHSADEVRRARDTLDAVIDASPLAIVCSDLDRKIMLWNRGAEQIYGYSEAEVIGRAIPIVRPEDMDMSRQLYRRARSGETLRGVEVRRLRKDGSSVDICLSAAPLFGPDGAVRGVAFLHEDMTARKQAEEQLRRFAHYDQLTGLANRHTLEGKLDALLRGGSGSAVILLDLDGFKDVNDTLGHSTGDQLLIEVADRLKAAMRNHGSDAFACRLGGDEFVAILPGCGDPLAASEIVGAMLTRLAAPYEIAEHVLHLGASAGLAIAPLHGSSVAELLSNADLALYQAKKDGGRMCRMFTPTLRAQAQVRRGLAAELPRALDRGEFELFYQPQVRLADGAVTGAEALLRWRHPQRGILGPGPFIDALAASAIAPALGRWIIETACTQAAAWRASGCPLGRIAVNLFPTQLRRPALIDDVEHALRASALPPEVLELEITENIALSREEAALPLQMLRAQGVKIAFDDFGTGYASLRCLTMFPVSRIKIDRSFVERITNSARDAAIVRSIITMAKSLDLEVVAEGVETDAQAAFLRNERCQEAQGYLYGKPLMATEFAAYLNVARIARLGADAGAVGDAGHHAIKAVAR
jgi:diguanylate cyclase (GGDEF)-like protein/PAS domain S-box-containing protein